MTETVTRDEYLVAIGQKRAPKKNKYRNEPQVVDGKRFASKREAARYGALVLEQKAGRIRGLKLQVPFSLAVNQIHVCVYLADFVYERRVVHCTPDRDQWATVVEDAKGKPTNEYRIKKRLMLACHGIEILES